MYKIITEQEIVTKEVTEKEVTLMEFIGHKVAECRRREDINLSQLSRRLIAEGHSITSQTLGRIEKGQTPLRIQDLAAIASHFKVKMGVFYPEGTII